MATLPLIQRDHNIHISLNKHWWCVLCCLFQLPLSKEDDNSSCWMSPRWAICGFDSRWLPISSASLRANASSVHDMPQMESFLACFSFPCLVNNSLRASSPVWANEPIRARIRERAAKTLLPAAFASPLAFLSRVYFLLYPPNGELARRLLFMPL